MCPSAALWMALLASASFTSAAVLPPEVDGGGVHRLMTEQEMRDVFGDHDAATVDYELVYIRQHSRPKRFDPAELLQRSESPEKRSQEADDLAHYSFDARGKNYQLKLKPNTLLVAPKMKTVVRGETEQVIDAETSSLCHYVHVEEGLVAAISHCTDSDVRGYIIDSERAMEIRPLSSRLRKILHPEATSRVGEDGTILVGPHILKPARHLSARNGNDHGHNCSSVHPPVVEPPIRMEKRKSPAKGKSTKATAAENMIQGRAGSAKAARMILELGIFLDEAMLNLFMPYFSQETSDREQQYIKLREMVLAFVNGMQALYHLPSLGQAIDLSIVYMEFQAKQPAGLPTFEGERGALLTSFCDYQRKLNKPSDKDSEHWDMALYLSGLDFFANEGGRRNFVTMGLATVTGVCTDTYNCVIGEMGVVNQNGQPYPSTGFTSVYVMAHEIGHNLGMSHDSSGNSCPADGYIMSPSRGVVGETQWSSCSANYLKTARTDCMFDMPSGSFPNYNHDKYGDKPGQLWTADDQCRILLRDHKAYAFVSSSLADICNTMKCRTPNRDGYFNSGPALPGTVCGSGRWCSGGQCVQMSRSISEGETAGGWSPWKEGSCASGCLVKAKGVITKTRKCDSPKPSSTLGRCQGEGLQMSSCDDSALCKSRTSVQDYASKQCASYGPYVPAVDVTAAGMQAPLSHSRPWQSCAVFCKRKDRSVFYTPRLELNNLPDVDAFFPDGTWCGNDGSRDYYCMQRVCLPDGKPLSRLDTAVDFEVDILNNAPLTSNGQLVLPPSLEEYFMVDKDGKPIKENVDSESLKGMEAGHETGFVDNDFVTIKP